MKMLQKPTDKKRNAVGNMILFALLVALLITVDATSHSYDMIVKVLQKGCVYAVVVVSMNLLNGFTGLFSLGQAGFMLIGAYVYAIFSVDDASRAMVYGFSGEPLIDFRRRRCRALCISYRTARPQAQKRLSCHCHARLCGDTPHHHTVG